MTGTTEDRSGEDGSGEDGPYRVLLAQGTLYITGLQLANVSVVLPFIAAEHNLLWVAGLLYAASGIGIVAGNSLSPYVMQRAKHQKHLLIAGATAVMAVFVAASAIAARTGILVATVFLSSSLLMGLVSGLSRVAFSEVISSKLPEERRRDLVLIQGALGAVAAILTTLLLVPYLAQREPQGSQLDLLWLGAGCFAVAAVLAGFVGPVAGGVRHDRVTFAQTYREGLAAARSQPWFRDYAWIMVLFVPVSLGTPFYSVHASVNHAGSAGSLPVLVVSSSTGLVLGALFWRFVSQRWGVRAMFVVSALLGSVAALICVVIEVRQEWNHVWIYAVVFVLATIANQAIFSAGLIWVGAHADDDHRATLLGFGALMIAAESALLGAALGALAQNAAILGPLVALLVLNLAAAVAAVLLAPKPDRQVTAGREAG
ncbi:MFS transporter [Mycobacterium sp. Y57]|uniref:MFS transporter n=1 Tax=Mycolicibacterium xanthum TaxID=2796469 RepID=UPI001C853109|nr:MFS transporter [Mycolicibacterium xanthum]MBX7435323.1 MFS transporter [Mycolicibacterium xanthum]